MTLKAQKVFTPGGFPEHTYIEREEKDYETQLKDALDARGHIISISGPSKSGKTVLVERVVGDENLITITGAGIENSGMIWERILNWMEAPSETAASDKSEKGGTLGGEIKGEVGLPGMKAQITGRAAGQASAASTQNRTFKRTGMQQVIGEIADSDFVILIDDFHYMTRAIQEEVAQQLKEAVRQGLSIIVASVLHRSDDIVRALPELRGRVISIDLEYWNIDDLRQIAMSGFNKLNIEISPDIIGHFTAEAAGSPQLMQSICLYTCLQISIRETSPLRKTFGTADININRVFERTAMTTDFRSLVDVLDSGPKKRGTERKIYQFNDGVSGDVYRCILKAVAASPPQLSFGYPEILERVEQVCNGDQPIGSSIVSTCVHMSKLATDNFPRERAIDWDENKQVLDIPDPYLLFYLRWSARLMETE